jgi:branched-chain amino acid transport system permease protein
MRMSTAWARTAKLAVLAVVLCGIVALSTMLGTLSGPRLDRATGTALIMLLVVVGLKIFIGDAGVFSFGHIAFMGIGAYTTAIVTMSPGQRSFQLPDLPGSLATLQLSGIEAALLSGVVAAVVASIVGIPMLRLSGLTASLATVAVLIVFRSLFQNVEMFTRGSSGLIIDAATPSIVTLLLWACFAILVALVFRQSRIGLRLAASREDEIAARALGVRVWSERGIAFALSAFVVGVAGSLFAQYFGSINPDSFFITLTFTTIAMLVVGGLTSVSGAVVGTLVISVALELLRTVERGVSIGGWEVPSRSGLSEVGLALVLLVVLLTRPSGLTSGRELDPVSWLRRLGPKRNPVGEAAPSTSEPTARDRTKESG